MSVSGSVDVSHEDCSSVSLVQLGDVGPWLGTGDTTRAFIGAAECEAVKVGPTSEIEFKVQFERAAVVGKILTFLGAGQACGARRGAGTRRGKQGGGRWMFGQWQNFKHFKLN